MAKISRPIIYAVVLAIAGYGVFVLTEPTPPAKKKKPRTTVAAKSAPVNGILPEDLKAHFDPYVPKQARNPFQPRVVSVRSLAATAPKPGPGIPAPIPANWVLTGITAINNIKSALLENSATGDSVFLKPGDKWNGLRVTAVGDASIRLVDATGRITSLGFPEPPETPAPGATPAPNAGAAPANARPTQVASGPQGGANGL